MFIRNAPPAVRLCVLPLLNAVFHIHGALLVGFTYRPRGFNAALAAAVALLLMAAGLMQGGLRLRRASAAFV